MRIAASGASYSWPDTVISVIFDLPPSVALSVIFSTRSFPAKFFSRSPSAATIVNVVCACSTLGPTGRLTDTLAVALVVVPLSAGLIAEDTGPSCGITLSSTVLPTGTLDVVKTTVTGFVVVAGSVTSATPVGAAGAGTPATLLMVSVGNPATNTLPGRSDVAMGLEAAVRVMVSASSRTRPGAPPVA